jgi:hypothetical protein
MGSARAKRREKIRQTGESGVAVKKQVVIGAAAAISLACAGAPAAVAAPKGGFAVFAQCPVHTEGVGGCLYAPVGGGYLTLGKTVVPIAKTLVLQAGFLEEREGVLPLVGALDGETLTKVGQALPGGLFGRPLDAVTELAAPASSILVSGLSGEGLALTLPIKVRLVNPLLGAECSIGSNAHPIELNMTTETSGPLTGNPGETTSIERGKILVMSGVSMVSSGFSVPKAGGCGSAVVDEAVDAKLGLPLSKSTAAAFDMTVELANASAVESAEG